MNGWFWTDFTKWLFGALLLGNRFQNHPGSVILQKCQSLSNQSLKDNQVHMPSLYLTLCFLLNLGFVCLSVTNTIHKVNACSHWTPPCLSFVFDFYKFIMQTSLQLRILISEWLSWLKTRFSNLFLNSWQRMWHLKKLSKKSHIQNVVLVNFSLTTKKSYCSSLNI